MPKRSPAAARRAAERADAGDIQLNIRLAADLAEWLERRAGDRRAVAGFVRGMIEERRRQEQEQELLAMFNEAARELTEEDREERRLFMGAHPADR